MAKNIDKTCFLCKSSEDNELLFGKFYSKWKISVHYYCLLLSSNLVQRGNNDTAGIFGFLKSDIRKENERARKYRCYICKRMHANVSCCSKKCLRTFHTVCGITNGCLSHYTGTYQSWCSAHVPLEPDSDPHSPEEACSICYDEMGQYDLITSIKAPCCRNGWFHQRCLAQYAESAGYFFKCPLCKNEDKFVAEVPLRGVFVPERDAAWELEPNAFQEQLLRPTACDAEDCKCEQGRSVDNHRWPLVICGSCGSTCRHRQCMEHLKVEKSQVYLCQLCRPIVGERLSLLENVDGSSNSSDDVPTSSGESCVDNSSSDEPLTNLRQLAHTSGRRMADSSDSERSDGSSNQIRRFVRLSTGKRVRRLLSEGSEDMPRSENTCQSLETPTQHIERSPGRQTADRSSDSSERVERPVRLTRQLARRSLLSDTSNRSSSESTNNSDKQRTKITNKRWPRIASSSDESEKSSESGKQAGDGVASSSASSSSSSSSSIVRRLSSSSSKASDKRSENQQNSSDELDDLLLSKERERIPFHFRNGRTSHSSIVELAPVQLEPVPAHSASERDENSNVADTAKCRSPPKGDNANASEMPSKSISTKRTRQLSKRYAAKAHSTNESSIEVNLNKSKRIRISAPTVSSEEETQENREAATKASQKNGGQVARERPNRSSPVKEQQSLAIVSSPSTPSSLSAEASQQSATSNRKESNPVKDANRSSRTVKDANRSSRTSETLNRQQNAMLQFLTVTSSQNDQTSRKQTVETSKRTRTYSAGKRPEAVSPATDQSAGKKQSPSGPTSSKSSIQPRPSTLPKDKGQKNILNYFNRC